MPIPERTDLKRQLRLVTECKTILTTKPLALVSVALSLGSPCNQRSAKIVAGTIARTPFYALASGARLIES